MSADDLYAQHSAAINSAVSRFMSEVALPSHLRDELQSLALYKFVQLVPTLQKRTDIRNVSAYVRKAIRNHLCDQLKRLLAHHTSEDVDLDTLPARSPDPLTEVASNDAVEAIRMALSLACDDALDDAIVECMARWGNAARTARYLGVSADIVGHRRFRLFLRLPRHVQQMMTTRPIRRIERFLSRL